MSELKKGDRVTVDVPRGPKFNGVIAGEARNGLWWNIIKDGTKSQRGWNKDFCYPQDTSHE